MNIAFISTVFLSGGVEQVMCRIATELQKKGHNIQFFILEEFHQAYQPPHIQVHFMNFQRARGFERLYQFKKSSRLLERKIHEVFGTSQPLIVSHMPETDRYTRYLPLKKCSVIHGILDPWYEKRSPTSKFIKAYKLNRRYKNSTLICVSQYIKKNMRDIIPPQVTTVSVIYSPFPIKNIQSLSLEPLSTQLPQRFFLYAGRFSQEKRLDILLQAYASGQMSSDLVLMGTGAQTEIEKIHSLAQKLNVEHKVHFIGFHKNPYNIMKAATALILCSEFEGFGNVLLESLLVGTPSLALDCPGGPREILSGDLGEYLLPKDDFAGLINKMKELEDTETRIRFSDAFYKFDSQRSATEYERLFQDIMLPSA